VDVNVGSCTGIKIASDVTLTPLRPKEIPQKVLSVKRVSVVDPKLFFVGSESHFPLNFGSGSYLNKKRFRI
jgi:hypothetical protein